LRIPHGINNDFFIEQVRTHHKGDIFKIVSVTRLLSLKNIDLVLRSIIKLIEAGNKIEYTIIGEGPEEKRLKEFVEINNLVSVVTFKPWMSHESIIEELKKNHLFAMVSYPENLGRVYFESIAGSLPILGARESGAYDLLLKGHGAHYAYLSEESITESITEIIKDYNNVGRAAVEGSRYLRNFDWDRMTELYYSLIRKTRPQ
jgi:glycosyltransferase involved in cell wall biosynthesis